MATEKKTSTGNFNFAIPTENYKYMAIGMGIVVIGYFLMMGGGSKDPNVFNADMFNFRRTILSPIVVLIGYIFEIWAIMRTPKAE
jgi:hypothetical protein